MMKNLAYNIMVSAMALGFLIGLGSLAAMIGFVFKAAQGG